MIDLTKAASVEALRDEANRLRFINQHQAPMWFNRAYADLAHAADVLAAFLEREIK